jgi:putative inorganic carbon (hco3(-)) transporter
MPSIRNFIPISPRDSVQATGWKGQWLGALGLLALLGFTWLPNSYSLMVSWPYAALWQGAFCLLVGWSIWISRQFSKPLAGLGHSLDGIILFVALGNGLSVLNAEFRLVAGWNALLLSSYGVVLYLSVNWIRQLPAMKERLWFSLAACGTITSLISLAYWRPTPGMWTSQDFYSAIRNPYPLGHHNFVGGYCLLVLPLVIGFTLTQVGKKRWIGWGAIALNTTALYISGSRGALLGGLAIALLTLTLYVIYYPRKTRKHWLLAALLSLLVIGALMSNPRVRSLTSFSPSTNNAAPSLDQIDDGPTKDRLFMLQAGRRIFATHPLLGVGPGNLARVYNLYRPLETGGGLELVQQLHNTPAQILAELGIVGFSGYVLWVGWLLKLGIALHKTLYKNSQNKTDRILLYSIGASWFAYAISSLTDYQLENIGIASTLIITTALLIYLANEHLPASPPPPLTQRTRRLVSLGLLLYLSILIQTWARANAGFYLASAAQKDAESFNFADANAKWMTAHQLMPWDPTYAALSAEQLATVQQEASEQKNKDLLGEEAITSLTAALKSAPNDPWFNQNLAVLRLTQNPPKFAQAEAAIRRTVLLFPRSQHYSYYTLGYTYLQQQKKSQATTAFTLESIANPAFLADPLWNNPPFAELLPDVVDRTLTAWQQILASTAPDSYQAAWLQQQIASTQWWHHQPPSIQPIDLKKIDPLIRAILQIESDPTSSKNLLAQIIQTPNADTAASKATLLQAWLTPDQHLSEFLKSFKGTPAEEKTVTDNIHTHRNLRKWLTSITQPHSAEFRYGLAFAYRNASANNIRQILSADGPTTSPLLEEFTLFSTPPREFPQLDQKIVELGAQELALIPPSQNHVQLSSTQTHPK